MKLNRNKIIAIYIIWAFFHLILLLTSGNFVSRYDSDFFPFPIYSHQEKETYAYKIYQRGLDVFTTKSLGTYEEFCNKIQSEEKLEILYQTYKVVDYFSTYSLELDSTSFINNLQKAIREYGVKKYYSIYNYFPEGFEQYDYSEFIIYLLFPLVITYPIKLWFKKV